MREPWEDWPRGTACTVACGQPGVGGLLEHRPGRVGRARRDDDSGERAVAGPGAWEKSAEGVSEGRAPSLVPTAGDGLAVLNWHDSHGWVSARDARRGSERGRGLELDVAGDGLARDAVAGLDRGTGPRELAVAAGTGPRDWMPESFEIAQDLMLASAPVCARNRRLLEEDAAAV